LNPACKTIIIKCSYPVGFRHKISEGRHEFLNGDAVKTQGNRQVGEFGASADTFSSVRIDRNCNSRWRSPDVFGSVVRRIVTNEVGIRHGSYPALDHRSPWPSPLRMRCGSRKEDAPIYNTIFWHMQNTRRDEDIHRGCDGEGSVLTARQVSQLDEERPK
jgi:hypothetical protein